MTRRDKIMIGLMLIIILLLAVGVFSLTNKIATLESSIQLVANSRNVKPQVYNGTDGKDGISIKGENGTDGSNGIDGKDSVSTYSKEVIIKEVPIVGAPGKDGMDGKDADKQEIRINPETGDLESKDSSWRLWTTLIPCNELKVSCIKDTATKLTDRL